MNRIISFDQLKAFIDHQLKPSAWEMGNLPKPFVTISRQAGAGGITIGQKLVDYLEKTIPTAGAWTVLDKILVDRVLDEYGYPRRIAEYMPEAKADYIQSTVEELLGLHPSLESLIERIAKTVFSLAQLGNVVLVGRGSHLITAKLPQGFHVRLVGSVEKRTAHLAQYHRIGLHEAAKMVKTMDHDRKAYLKQHFDKDIDDPTLYHLVINTDRVSYDEAAAMIGEAVVRRAAPLLRMGHSTLHTAVN